MREVPSGSLPNLEKYYDYGVFLNSQDMQIDVGVWMGNGGTKSNLHWDPWNNLIAQIYGRKLIVLYHPSEINNLHTHRENIRTSCIDPYFPDVDTYPRYRLARGMISELRPGDTVFIPMTWWHHLRSMETSISLNCFFGEHCSLNYAFSLAVSGGLRQGTTIFKDFFTKGFIGCQFEKYLGTGDPTGLWLYSILRDAIKRRIRRFGAK